MTRQIAHLVRLVALPSLLMLGAASAPAVSAGNPCFHGYDMPATTIGPGTDIKLMPCAFEPTVTTVPVGTEVTFFNGPEYTHLITGANQEWGSPEAEVQPNATVTYMFDKAGVYPYACALHPGMSGAIVVGDLADVLGAGSMKTSTSGGSGASTGEGSGESNASAASTSGAEASPASPLIALAAAIGFTVLALAVWLAIRRRSVASRPLARAE